MAYKAAIFDLDGTLVDSLADLAEATNYALQMFGQPSRDLQAFRQMVGDGTRTLISRALEPTKQDLVENVLGKMREKYAQICIKNTKPYGEILQIAAELAKKGVKLAVLTNKDQKTAQQIVGRFFGQYFQIIKGTTAAEPVKPEPSAALEVLEKFNVKPQEAVFIGDSGIDIQTAKAAGIKAVGVSWGFRGRKELADAGADAIIDKPGELLRFF